MKHTSTYLSPFKALRATALAALLATAAPAAAMPALPRPIVAVQPDGTTVTIIQRGDERTHWAETTDGYTLLRDSDGWWSFAQKEKDGTLTASALRYTGTSAAARAAGIPAGLCFSRTQLTEARRSRAPRKDMLIDATFPQTGKRKLLMLLVNFSNTTPQHTREEFDNMMNQEGYAGIGSFRDYYYQSSYGKLDIETTVTPWITLPDTKLYYGTDGVSLIISEALKKLGSDYDLSQFDNDGDGVLDGLTVVHQGAGQEATASTSDIWSHSGVIYGLTVNGVTVSRYTIVPELLGSTGITTLGVITHEFGHNLGAPDFYDTDYSESGGEFGGTGKWDLMASGAWNCTLSTRPGNCPSGINAWQKYVFGWCDMETLTEDTDVSALPSSDKSGVVYRMDTATPGEYFVFENRQKAWAFDQAIPGHGLVAYRANESLISANLTDNTLNCTHPQAFYTLCAAATMDPVKGQTSSYGDTNSEDTPFPGTKGKNTVFNDGTYPSARTLTDSRRCYTGLEDITENADGTVSFKFRRYAEPAKPHDLAVSTAHGKVTLTWGFTSEGEQPTRFNVYRGDSLIGQTPAQIFVDEKPLAGQLATYRVDATYADGNTSLAAYTQIRVPTESLLSLTATPKDNGAEIAWSTDNTLTRIEAGSGTSYTTFQTAALEMAHRYTVTDLRSYVGATIRRIGFLPLSGPSVASYTLHVWRADDGGENKTLVSTRQVKEFGTGVYRDMALTQPVTIEAGHEYWIGVECANPSEGAVKAGTDTGPVLDGRGNWMLYNGNWVTTTSGLTGNFYIKATLALPDDMGNTFALPATYDPALDLIYPVGFRLYRDGTPIATTTQRSFSDTPEDDIRGTHTYTVTCVYADGNESAGLSQETDITAIRRATADTPYAPRVACGAGTLSLPAYSGPLTLIDAAGRTIFSGHYTAGKTFALPAGIYVIKSSATQKAAVR